MRKTLFATALLALAIGCRDEQQRTRAVEMTGGDPNAGKQAMLSYGCHGCHVIPGVPGADGVVGPSLAGMAARSVIAGRIPNSPENLKRFIMDPQSVDPQTAMPDVGVKEKDGKDMTAYLYTLK